MPFFGTGFQLYSRLIAGVSRRFEDAQSEGGGEGYRLHELESMVIGCLWVAIYRKINAHL